MDDKIESILVRARNAISSFCVNDCKAYCCRKGYLVLTKEEMELTLQNKQEEYLKDKCLKELVDGKFSLYLNPKSCPSLKDNKCLIHKNLKRSQTCKTFPIRVDNNTIYISKRCLASRTNLFYPFIEELIQLGCKLGN